MSHVHIPYDIKTVVVASIHRKRGGSSSCLFNAGLAHNCDYRDVVGAVNEMNHWGSDLAPGKRRKREAGSPVGILKRLLENRATRF